MISFISAFSSFKLFSTFFHFSCNNESFESSSILDCIIGIAISYLFKAFSYRPKIQFSLACLTSLDKSNIEYLSDIVILIIN